MNGHRRLFVGKHFFPASKFSRVQGKLGYTHALGKQGETQTTTQSETHHLNNMQMQRRTSTFETPCNAAHTKSASTAHLACATCFLLRPVISHIKGRFPTIFGRVTAMNVAFLLFWGGVCACCLTNVAKI